jgi:penicillin amidase
LKNWNLQNDINEEGATIFKILWDSVEVAVFSDEFAQTELPLRWPDESTLVEALIKDTAYPFVDDITTSAVESIGEIIRKAYKMAYKEIKDADNKQELSWGKFKNTAVRHLLKIPALSRMNLPIGGGEHIINATKPTHGPSVRLITHLTAKTEAYIAYPGGQHGNPGSKFYDMFVDTWASGIYYRVLFLTADEARQSNQIKWRMNFSNS